MPFARMAANERANHESKFRAEKRKQAEQHESRSKVIEASIQELTTFVLPVLERAKAQFAQNGIETEITTHFDVKDPDKTPSISFRCTAPRRISDGWLFETNSVVVNAHGEALHITVSDEFKNYKKDFGFFRSADSETVIAEGIKLALHSYFEALTNCREHSTDGDCQP